MCVSVSYLKIEIRLFVRVFVYLHKIIQFQNITKNKQQLMAKSPVASVAGNQIKQQQQKEL